MSLGNLNIVNFCEIYCVIYQKVVFLFGILQCCPTSCTVWTVYYIQNPEGHRPKWKHKHINRWWIIHTKHTQGNTIKYLKSNYLVQYNSLCHHNNILALTINSLSRYHTLLYYIFHQLFLYRLLRSECMDTYFT